MNIVTDYNALSVRSDEIDTKKENALLREIILKLKETISDNNLTGLAAPQLGYYKRVFVINFKGKLQTYINPVIASMKGMELSKEESPSFPGKRFLRPRSGEIKIMFQNPMGKAQSQKLVGLAAVIFQELIDHLDGLLLPDVGLEIDDDFDNASDEERAEVINSYLDSLDIAHKSLKEEINSDPEAKQISDAVDFMTSVKRGETKIELETVKV